MDERSTVSFCRHLRKTMSKAETVLWTHLRGNRMQGLRFRRQHPIGPFVADFACVKARLVIEVDGDTHATDEAQAYDARRTKYLAKQGWRERRFSNEAVLTNLDYVLEEIRQELKMSPQSETLGETFKKNRCLPQTCLGEWVRSVAAAPEGGSTGGGGLLDLDAGAAPLPCSRSAAHVLPRALLGGDIVFGLVVVLVMFYSSRS